jgi:hypothetical protein
MTISGNTKNLKSKIKLNRSKFQYLIQEYDEDRFEII